jgi:probable HAF family extracellular repeat protein
MRRIALSGILAVALAVGCGGSSNGGNGGTAPSNPSNPAEPTDAGMPGTPGTDGGTAAPPVDGGGTVTGPDAGTPATDGGTTTTAFLYDVFDLGNQAPGIATTIHDDGVITGLLESMTAPFISPFKYNLSTHVGVVGNEPPDQAQFFSFDENFNGVGQYFPPPGGSGGFLYVNGTLTDLGGLGGGNTRPQAFNSSFQVVGSANVTNNGPVHAFLWQGGAMTDLGTLGGLNGEARAINDAGQITGTADTATPNTQHAFLWQNGAMTDLGALPASSVTPSSIGAAVNSRGHVAGYSAGDQGPRAFLWDGSMHDLGAASVVSGVNDSDVVVGTLGPGDNQLAFATVNGKVTDLNTVVAPSTFRLWQATSIDNSGRILGLGGEQGGQNPRNFLLVPRN